MKLFATKASLKEGGRLQLVSKPSTHKCETCDRPVSTNKRKCLKCIDVEIDFRLKAAAFKGESIGLD